MRKEELKNHEEGQAIFEFIAFMPFFLIIFASIIIIGGAINSSINQQKVVRGYYYRRIFNNSNLLDRDLLRQLSQEGMAIAGSFTIGWSDHFEGKTPVAGCFELPNLLIKDTGPESCSDKTTDEKSRFIKPKTVYGLCANTYRLITPEKAYPEPSSFATAGGCLLQKN